MWLWLITLLTNVLCQHAQLSVALAVWRDYKLRKKDHDRREIELSCNSAHEHKNKDVIDIDGMIAEFARVKGTHLALCLNLLDGVTVLPILP